MEDNLDEIGNPADRITADDVNAAVYGKRACGRAERWYATAQQLCETIRLHG